MSEPTAPTGASPRTIRAIPIVELPSRSASRGAIAVAIDPIGVPVLWSADRVDSGNERRGVCRFLVFRDGATTMLPIADTPAHGLCLVPGPDGRWLVLSRRVANAEEQNANLYSATGERVAAFHAGDGISDAQISGSGENWIGYFDEGVYSRDSLVGQDGLVCFSPDGTLLYGYNSDPNAPARDGISDCYAFNVTSAHETWLFYYSDFRLVRLVDRRVNGWWDVRTVAGASAVAVDGDRALFAGKYPRSHTRMEGQRRRIVIMKDDPEQDWLYLMTLATGAVEPLLPATVESDGNEHPISFSHRDCLARGSRLVIVGERHLYVVDLRDIT